MNILLCNLKENSIENVKEEFSSSSLALSLDLYDKYGKDAFVMVSSISESLEDSSRSSWSIVFYSEITKKRECSVLCLPHGISLRRLGYDGLVITGKSDKLKYISLTSNGGEIIPCENTREARSSEFEKLVSRNKTDLVLSTGVGGDKGVWYAELQFRGRNISSLSSGHAFYLHNLKGIVFPGFPLLGDTKRKNKTEKKNIRGIKKLRKYGNYSFMKTALKKGFVPIKYYSSRFDPRCFNLDGKALLDKYGSYPESCGECEGECYRRTSEGSTLPDLMDIFSLGTNLGFFDIENINIIFRTCVETSLNTKVVGAMLSYIFTLPEDEREKYGLLQKTVENIVSFIYKLSTGSILYRGLEDLPFSIQSVDHRPITFDLRGSFSSSLRVSLGMMEKFTPETIFTPKNISIKSISIITLYSTLLSLGLSYFGYPEIPPLFSFFKKLPRFVMKFPFLFRLCSHVFSFYGISFSLLIEKGIMIYKRLGFNFSSLPHHFLNDGDSLLDSTFVPLRRLQEEWGREMLKAERVVLSKREIRSKWDGKNKTKVGPREDLASDGEPGLIK